MITFYDSGIGGLTVLSEFIALSDNKDFEYFADIDILPLGNKNPEEILHRVKTVAQKNFINSNLLVLACNTASVNTIRELQQKWLPDNFSNKQILSISKPITELLDSKTIEFKKINLVILCTQATAKSGFYQNELSAIGYNKITTISCQGLCELIEKSIDAKIDSSQLVSTKKINNILKQIYNYNQINTEIKDYIKNLGIKPYSNILLACTHYPIIKNIIQKINPTCSIIDPSKYIAKKLVDYIHKHPKFM